MTAIEVFNVITAEPKWYAGFTTPQNASNIKKRFEEKELSFDTLEKMFNHFGYFLSASWDKKHEHTFSPCDEKGDFIKTGTNPGSCFAKCTICGYRP